MHLPGHTHGRVDGMWDVGCGRGTIGMTYSGPQSKQIHSYLDHTNKRATDVLEMSAFVGSCEKSHAIEVITTIEGLLICSCRLFPGPSTTCTSIYMTNRLLIYASI